MKLFKPILLYFYTMLLLPYKNWVVPGFWFVRAGTNFYRVKEASAQKKDAGKILGIAVSF